MIKVIPERDIIYIAGLCDGESSIYVKKAFGKTNPIHSLDVELTMTDYPTVKRVHDILGFGSFRPVRRNKAAHHKQAWKFIASSRDAETLLNLIVPYLVTKKEEALLALKFCELKRNRVGRGGLSDEMIEKREYIYQELKALKKQEYTIEEYWEE